MKITTGVWVLLLLVASLLSAAVAWDMGRSSAPTAAITTPAAQPAAPPPPPPGFVLEAPTTSLPAAEVDRLNAAAREADTIRRQAAATDARIQAREAAEPIRHD